MRASTRVGEGGIGSRIPAGTSDYRLVGRREECTRLRAVLRRMGSGGGISAVAIAGEPGIGKSRLLAELLEVAEDAQSLTLSGRAAQFERDVPFAVFVDALDGYLASQNPRRLEALGSAHLTELARIFPSLGKLGGPARGAVQAERYRAHYAVRGLLDSLARARPVVLALDDLQWADEASLELASHLLRRPGSTRGLLALAYRAGEAPSRLADAVAVAIREDRLELVELGPLSEAEMGQLLPGHLKAEARSRLYRDSGGNPFYLEQLWRSLEAGAGAASRAEPHGVDEDVPAAVAAALAGEVGALSSGARALLEGASVAGDPFSLELAAAAAGLAEPESREALDELLSRELVHPTEVPRRFGFRHPVARRTVYAAAKEGWRLGAHARVRDALNEQGASATELAHHVAQAATPGDEEAIAVLERAAQAAARLGPGPAAHWLGAALRLLPESEVARRLELLVPMAAALAASGRFQPGRDAIVEALDLLPGEAETQRTRLITRLATVDHLLGRHKEARAVLHSELSSLANLASPAAIALQLELSVGSYYAADWEGAREWAERALDGAQAADQVPHRITAEALICLACLALGRIADGERHGSAAGELMDSLGDPQLAMRLDAALYLGWAEYFLERYGDGVRHHRRGVAISRSTGRGQLLTQMKGGEALNLIELGRAKEATDLADETLEAARLAGNRQGVVWALWIRGRIAGSTGHLEDALKVGEEALAIDAELEASVISVAVRAHFAAICVEAGDHQRCVREMERAGAPEFRRFYVERRLRCWEALSRAALGLGEPDEAEHWVARCEALTEDLDLPVAVAVARRARARLLLARGVPDPAAETALEAAAGQESRGARIEAARSRILAGQALAAAELPDRAVAELQRAYSELDACEVIRYRDEAARELRRLGQRMPRVGRRAAAAVGVAALSEREREIAELAAAAKTNREIAATLYISEKTVEKHLSKVFAKLGVSGRAAIGARLAAEGDEAARA
ncbi:MAG: AAA family ATPase [Solirubrobacterales bacterium]|nr:AAA family ATPase [Solirubrobacterales bacterium]